MVGMGEAAVDVLAPLLRKGRLDDTLRAAETLGQVGVDKAVEPLSALLGSKRPEIAAAAAQALGRIGSDLAVEPLLQNAVESGSSLVKAESEKALTMIGASAVRPLLEYLHSNDPEERKTAVRLLGEIGDERALQPLVSARDDNSLQPELQTALERLGWQSREDEN
jgi:HEAT repeat protein